MNKKIKFLIVLGLVVVLVGLLITNLNQSRDLLAVISKSHMAVTNVVISKAVQPLLSLVGFEGGDSAGVVNIKFQQIPGSKLVLGGVYTLEDGENINGGLLVLGGNVRLREGSTVLGDVAMLSGNLQADGAIQGNIIAIGGLVQLSDSSSITGDVNVLGGELQGEELAEIQGQVNSDMGNTFPVVAPGGFRLHLPNLQSTVNPIREMLWLFFQSFLWSALAVLAVLFLAKPVKRVANVVISQPVVAGGLGLLTIVIAPFIILITVITIIGIPIAVLAVLALIIAWVYGVIAIGTETGERLAKLGKADWALPVSAGLGTFLLTLIMNGAGKFIPCIGWLLPFLVGLVGLGAVLLTRFGSRVYPVYEETEAVANELPSVDPNAKISAPVDEDHNQLD